MSLLKALVPEVVKNPLRARLHAKRYTYSQAGQDYWVFAEVFNERKNGFFLDIGAHDGVELSNTFVLETRYGWRGICVEANPDTFSRLQANRTATCVNACLAEKDGIVRFSKSGMFGEVITDDRIASSAKDRLDIIGVRATTLEGLLRKLDAPGEIDYLSMDIEGSEEPVLRGFPFATRKIKCMTIERPSSLLREIFVDNGFCLVKEIPGLDCFYLHSDYVETYLSNVFAFYEKKLLVWPMQ